MCVRVRLRKTSKACMELVGKLGLVRVLELAHELELDGRRELACALEQDGK